MSIKQSFTGMTHGKLGMILFLSSEIMLFAGLVSSYIILRIGSLDWPNQGETLSVISGGLNTIILLLSAYTYHSARCAYKNNDNKSFRQLLCISTLLVLAFLAIKFCAYGNKIAHHQLPSTNNFLALYFILTGVHALHVIGGIFANIYFLSQSSAYLQTNKECLINRLECTGLYWIFVDVVWLILFALLYLS